MGGFLVICLWCRLHIPCRLSRAPRFDVIRTRFVLTIRQTMTDTELEAFARAISRVLGWAYFLSW
jgi:hypothetical protein